MKELLLIFLILSCILDAYKCTTSSVRKNTWGFQCGAKMEQRVVIGELRAQGSLTPHLRGLTHLWPNGNWSESLRTKIKSKGIIESNLKYFTWKKKSAPLLGMLTPSPSSNHCPPCLPSPAPLTPLTQSHTPWDLPDSWRAGLPIVTSVPIYKELDIITETVTCHEKNNGFTRERNVYCLEEHWTLGIGVWGWLPRDRAPIQ